MKNRKQSNSSATNKKRSLSLEKENETETNIRQAVDKTERTKRIKDESQRNQNEILQKKELTELSSGCYVQENPWIKHDAETSKKQCHSVVVNSNSNDSYLTQNGQTDSSNKQTPTVAEKIFAGKQPTQETLDRLDKHIMTKSDKSEKQNCALKPAPKTANGDDNDQLKHYFESIPTTGYYNEPNDPNSRCMNDGSTPLHLAVRAKKKDVIEVMLKNGADVSITDYVGDNSLMIAIKTHEPTIVNNIWAHRGGLDINHANVLGLTALHMAVELKWDSCCHFLLNNGADPNVASSQTGSTPLMIAAGKGDMKIIERLIGQGADLLMEDHEGNTCVCKAFIENQSDTFTFLLNTISDDRKEIFIKGRLDLIMNPLDTQDERYFLDERYFPILADCLFLSGFRAAFYNQKAIQKLLLKIRAHTHNTDTVLTASQLIFCIFFECEGEVDPKLVKQYLNCKGPDLSMYLTKYYTETWKYPEKQILPIFLPMITLCHVGEGKTWLKKNYLAVSEYMNFFKKDSLRWLLSSFKMYSWIQVNDDLYRSMNEVWGNFIDELNEIQTEQREKHMKELLIEEELDKEKKVKRKEKKKQKRQGKQKKSESESEETKPEKPEPVLMPPIEAICPATCTNDNASVEQKGEKSKKKKGKSGSVKPIKTQHERKPNCEIKPESPSKYIPDDAELETTIFAANDWTTVQTKRQVTKEKGKPTTEKQATVNADKKVTDSRKVSPKRKNVPTPTKKMDKTPKKQGTAQKPGRWTDVSKIVDNWVINNETASGKSRPNSQSETKQQPASFAETDFPTLNTSVYSKPPKTSITDVVTIKNKYSKTPNSNTYRNESYWQNKESLSRETYSKKLTDAKTISTTPTIKSQHCNVLTYDTPNQEKWDNVNELTYQNASNALAQAPQQPEYALYDQFTVQQFGQQIQQYNEAQIQQSSQYMYQAKQIESSFTSTPRFKSSFSQPGGEQQDQKSVAPLQQRLAQGAFERPAVTAIQTRQPSTQTDWCQSEPAHGQVGDVLRHFQQQPTAAVIPFEAAKQTPDEGTSPSTNQRQLKNEQDDHNSRECTDSEIHSDLKVDQISKQEQDKDTSCVGQAECYKYLPALVLNQMESLIKFERDVLPYRENDPFFDVTQDIGLSVDINSVDALFEFSEGIPSKFDEDDGQNTYQQKQPVKDTNVDDTTFAHSLDQRNIPSSHDGKEHSASDEEAENENSDTEYNDEHSENSSQEDTSNLGGEECSIGNPTPLSQEDGSLTEKGHSPTDICNSSPSLRHTVHNSSTLENVYYDQRQTAVIQPLQSIWDIEEPSVKSAYGPALLQYTFQIEQAISGVDESVIYPSELGGDPYVDVEGTFNGTTNKDENDAYFPAFHDDTKLSAHYNKDDVSIFHKLQQIQHTQLDNYYRKYQSEIANTMSDKTNNFICYANSAGLTKDQIQQYLDGGVDVQGRDYRNTSMPSASVASQLHCETPSAQTARTVSQHGMTTSFSRPRQVVPLGIQAIQATQARMSNTVMSMIKDTYQNMWKAKMKTIRWKEELEELRRMPGESLITLGKIVIPKEDGDRKYIAQHSSGPIVLGYLVDGSEIAVKVIDSDVQELDMNDLQRLVDMNVNNHFVIKYKAVHQHGGHYYLAMELYEYTLEEYLHVLHEDPGVNASVMYNKLVWQLMRGLTSLHQHCLTVHGELRPNNVVIGLDGSLRLSGYGLIKTDNGPANSLNFFTDAEKCWLAPEILLQTQKPNVRSDIWVAGMLMYYILTGGNNPFGEEAIDIIWNISNQNYVIDYVSEEAGHLLGGMLSVNKTERPCISDVLSHPYFWSEEKRLRLIAIVGSDILREVQTGIPLTGGMINVIASTPCDMHLVNWIPEVEAPLLREMLSFRLYKNNTVELVLFVFNCYKHFSKMPDDVKEMMVEPSTYFLQKFPSLFMTIYLAVKMSSKAQKTCYRPFYTM